MIILKLFLVVLLISFCFASVSGVVMFFIDMYRFGTPHKRFEAVSSIEKYNEKLEKLDSELSESDPEEPETFEINL